MSKALYAILFLIFVSSSILIDRFIVEKKYFKKNIFPASLYLNRRLLGVPALLTPKDYFKEKNLKNGYFIYLFSFVLNMIAIYFLVMLIVT